MQALISSLQMRLHDGGEMTNIFSQLLSEIMRLMVISTDRRSLTAEETSGSDVDLFLKISGLGTVSYTHLTLPTKA